MPTTVTEGADPPDALPASAEDRKAAAAMSSLDVKSEEEPAQPKKEVDQKALAEAMKFLSVGEEKGKKAAEAGGKKKDVEAPKPVIKVDQADVALVAEACDMNKVKATELLRRYDADAGKAMGAWVRAGAGA